MRVPRFIGVSACIALCALCTVAVPAAAQFLDLDPELNTLQQISRDQQFFDIRDDDWFAPYVDAAARWGIVSGYADANGVPTGRFGPADLVTVGAALKMALRAARVDETTCVGEPQIAQARTHWARQFVVCGEQKNMRLLEAWPNLDRPALRGEVLSLIHDAFGDTVPPIVSTFADSRGHLYESDIAYAAALGIVSGDSDALGRSIGTFRPNSGVIRAEIAKIVVEKLKAEAADDAEDM